MSTATEEHELFRDSVRAWVEKELAPNVLEWEENGIVPREIFAAAGRYGFIGLGIPEEFGGSGTADFRFNAIVGEELMRLGIAGAGNGITLHNDITTPYFVEYCNDQQKQRWLPGIASGELITAIAMTEPGTGSDLAGIQTRAVREGDAYVVNGAKTFITSGINSDLVITAVRTGEHPHKGLSLLVLERGMPGFERGRNLAKVGQHAQDTAELSFSDVRVPVANLLGEEGSGFRYLVSNLAQERLSIAVAASSLAAACLEWTLDYVKNRKAFGAPLSNLQTMRHRLADVAAEVDVAATYTEDCLRQHIEGRLTPERAATAKLWTTEAVGRVTDSCLQMFGGYGYMTEYPIARAFVDARVTRIYGGTSEIMKEIISKSLGL